LFPNAPKLLPDNSRCPRFKNPSATSNCSRSARSSEGNTAAQMFSGRDCGKFAPEAEMRAHRLGIWRFDGGCEVVAPGRDLDSAHCAVRA
jgi:hypothetical protein